MQYVDVRIAVKETVEYALDASLAIPAGLSKAQAADWLRNNDGEWRDLRLKARGVRYFQGDLLGPPQEESPRALPSCDLDVLARLFRLARLGAPHDALAMAAAADPALVVRLLMLHRLYLNRLRPPASLTEALADLPEQVLIGWLHVLRTSTFDLSPHTRSWSQAVREQIHNYRARLIGARACGSPAELEAKVFDLYRRLCSREPIPPPTRPTLLERCGPF